MVRCCMHKSRMCRVVPAVILCQLVEHPLHSFHPRAACEAQCSVTLPLRVQAPETATLLATALARNITLRSLAVGDTNFGDAGAAALAPGLAASASLQRLDLSAKGIGPDGAAAIGGALAANPAAALTHLSIAGNALGDTGLRGLLPGLLMLRSLDLTCCGLNSGGSDAMPLLQGVLLQGQLTSLCLDGNALGAAAGASLGDGAAACTSLRKLSVVDTGLGDAGLSALAARLPAASLTQLNASGCAADRGGATALFDAVSSGAPLATLSLRANHLTAGDVAAALATALPPQLANGGGPSLANGSAAVANGAAGAVEPTVAAVPADGVPAAAVEAAAGFALQQLDLSENEGAADAPAVAALAQLTGLRRLSLFGCTGGDDVAREAAAQLAAGSWPHLKVLPASPAAS